MHELEEDLVHDLREVLLDPGHHVAAHADLGPRVERDGAVVGRHELGVLGGRLEAEDVDAAALGGGDLLKPVIYMRFNLLSGVY